MWTSTPAWLRANRHSIRYITTHNIATILHHTCSNSGTALTWQWGWLAENLLVELGQLSLKTLSQRKNWWCKPSQQEMSVIFAAGFENQTSTVTVWPSLEWGHDPLRISLFPGWATWLIVIERNDIKFNL